MKIEDLQAYRTEFASENAVLIFLLGEDAEGFAQSCRTAEQRQLDCVLCRIPVSDWNGQLSPWPGKAVFRGGEDFSGGAEAFLQEILPLMQEMKERCGCAHAALAGYSLAGLFALYAATQTDTLDAVAAMSPSVWYEGFMEYLEHHPVRNPELHVYLSLGKAEEKARNPVLRRVGKCVRQAQAMLSGQLSREVPLTMHDGGHHFEVGARMDAGIEWLAKTRMR